MAYMPSKPQYPRDITYKIWGVDIKSQLEDNDRHTSCEDAL